MAANRSTFSFDDEAYKRLNELSASTGVAKTEILRRAIAVYGYLNEVRGSNPSIKIEKPNGEKVELVFP